MAGGDPLLDQSEDSMKGVTRVLAKDFKALGHIPLPGRKAATHTSAIK